jgi:hydrogenase nickel incorporation protein HypB
MTIVTIPIGQDLRALRAAEAASFRDELTRRGILCINLISSPGAGKTTLLQATAKHWSGRRRMAVLVGDIATDRDARRLAPLVPVLQLTTGGACHLELSLVRNGFDAIKAEDVEFLFVENIGNLVCPASHDLGEHLRVTVLSVTEGDDKPGKYPKAFRTSRACVVSKTDLLPFVPFSVASFAADARLIRSDIAILPASPLQGEGVEEWCRFLEAERSARLKGRHFDG